MSGHDGTPSPEFVQRNATQPASQAPPWLGWDRATWDAYVQQTGETGRPTFSSTRGLVGISDGSTDIDRLGRGFSNPNSTTTRPVPSSTTTSRDVAPTPTDSDVTRTPTEAARENPSGAPRGSNPVPPTDPMCDPGLPNLPPGHTEAVNPTGDNFGWGNDPFGEFGDPSLATGPVASTDPGLDAFGGPGDAIPGPNRFRTNATRPASSSFIPNVLSGVDSATYNIKLYVTNPLAGTLESINAGGGVCIVESGVTTNFNLGDVRVMGYVGYNQGTTDSFGFEIFLKISEPYGMTLPERLVGVCQAMGIPNHLSAEYVLEIAFTGVDSETGGPAGDLEGLVWRIPCVLAKLDISVANGTEYDLVLYEVDGQGKHNRYGTLKQQLTVEVATLGEFFTELENAINEELAQQADGENASIPDVVKFELPSDPDPSGYTFALLDPTIAASAPVTNFALTGDGKVSVTLNKGTGISSGLIQSMFLATKEYQDELRASGLFSGQTDATTANRLKQTIRVETTVRPTDFDPLRNDYAREITYHPFFFDMVNMVVSPGAYRAQRDSAAETAQTKLNNLTNKGYLRKRYDYYYTGLNTEVININVALDNLWYQATEMYAGTNNQTQAFTFGRAASPEARANPVEEGLRPRLPGAIGGVGAGASTSANAGVKYLEQFDFKTNIPGASLANRTFSVDNIPKDWIHANPGAPDDANPLVGQVYYNLMTGDMVDIAMTIKGDPYWLGSSKLTRPGAQTSGRDDFYAPFWFGNNAFLFTMKTPNEVDDNTGQMPNMVYADTIAGTYFVYGVESVFSNGQFTQTLRAYQDETLPFGLIKSILRD